jgi:hypothetical protein
VKTSPLVPRMQENICEINRVASLFLLRVQPPEATKRSDDPPVPAEFIKWVFGGGVKLPGLVTRRASEMKLFHKL